MKPDDYKTIMITKYIRPIGLVVLGIVLLVSAASKLCAMGAEPSETKQDKPSWKPQITIYQPPPVEKTTSTLFVAVDPQIIQKLIELLDEQVLGSKEKVNETASLLELDFLLTPEGYELKNRYRYLGVALSESLGWEPIKNIRVISEQNLKQRLTTVARWDHTPRVRSIAIYALASIRDPNDIVYFREALWSRNVGIRYATIEALQTWGYPDAIPLLQELLKKDESLFLRVIAANALARLKDPAGMEYLRKGIESQDWFIRALSAMCMGDTGDYTDYDLLLNRLNREQENDFVIAEICISVLKLFPQKIAKDKEERELKKKKAQAAVVAPIKREVKPRKNVLFELEPLVVTAPRLRIPEGELVDPRVNYRLLSMLQQKEDYGMPQEFVNQSISYKDLNELITPAGIRLKTRYTNLGYLLTEGLAGTKDFQLLDQLIRLSREGKKVDVRSYALIALSYSKDRNNMGLFQEALQRQNAYERFPAIEALQAWGYTDAVSMLVTQSKLDRSPLLRIYAAQAALRLGDESSKNLLLQSLDDPDWVIRALAMRYLGELGSGDDYNKLLSYLGSQQEKIVQAEMCSALLRLYAKKMGQDQE